MSVVAGLARVSLYIGVCVLIGACARGQVDATAMRLDAGEFKAQIASAGGEVTRAEPSTLMLRERDLEACVLSLQRATKVLSDRGFSECGQAPATWDRVPKLIGGREYVADQFMQTFSRKRSESIEVVSLVSVAWFGTPPPGQYGATVQINVVALPAGVFEAHHDRRAAQCGIEALVAEQLRP